MTHEEAKETLQRSAAEIVVDEDGATATINGTVTI